MKIKVRRCTANTKVWYMTRINEVFDLAKPENFSSGAYWVRDGDNIELIKKTDAILLA